jgi:hypothetical protein
MGLVKYPKISDYWSRYFLYQNTLEPAVMTQNSFQDSVRLLHFADSTLAGDDYLAKIQHFIAGTKFQKLYSRCTKCNR